MTGQVTISRRIEWDMAHRLGPACATKCKNLHGHRYVAVATLTADRLDERGMVLDFADVFGAMQSFVDGRLDHGTVVDRSDEALLRFLADEGDKACAVDFPTTAENLCAWLAERFQGLFTALPGASERRVRLVSLRLFETPNCFADWIARDA